MFNSPYSTYPYGNYGMPSYSQRPYAPQSQQAMQNTQQIPMQPQPQMQYEMPIQELRFVTSEEAKAFIVMPNSKALLIDKNNGVAHLKVADNMGQSQTQYFRFEAINEDGTPIKPKVDTPQIDLEDFEKRFVTIQQYTELLDQFNQIKKIIGGKPNGTTTSKQPEQRM